MDSKNERKAGGHRGEGRKAGLQDRGDDCRMKDSSCKER